VVADTTGCVALGTEFVDGARIVVEIAADDD
jgi:hypothetical protein